MAAGPRLTLADYLADLRDGQLSPAQQDDQAQPRRLGDGTQCADEALEAGRQRHRRWDLGHAPERNSLEVRISRYMHMVHPDSPERRRPPTPVRPQAD